MRGSTSLEAAWSRLIITLANSKQRETAAMGRRRTSRDTSTYARLRLHIPYRILLLALMLSHLAIVTESIVLSPPSLRRHRGVTHSPQVLSMPCRKSGLSTQHCSAVEVASGTTSKDPAPLSNGRAGEELDALDDLVEERMELQRISIAAFQHKHETLSDSLDSRISVESSSLGRSTKKVDPLQNQEADSKLIASPLPMKPSGFTFLMKRIKASIISSDSNVGHYRAVDSPFRGHAHGHHSDTPLFLVHKTIRSSSAITGNHSDSMSVINSSHAHAIRDFESQKATGNDSTQTAVRRLDLRRRGLPSKSLRRLSSCQQYVGKSSHTRGNSQLIPGNVRHRRLKEHWKSPLLESGSAVLLNVGQEGRSDFSTIQSAIDSIPEKNTQRVILRIQAGIYRERVVVPYTKPFVTFYGDDSGSTVITWNNTASSSGSKYHDDQNSKYVMTLNTSSALFGTMESASVTVFSDGFFAQRITFENSAPAPEPGAVGAQAVALLVAGDRSAFYDCSFLGAQDTLYDYTGRHYYLNCYIQGSIDFIFGNARSLFEGCHLHSIATSIGAIAAQQRTSAEEDTGFSFTGCNVTGSGKLYLGRAWSAYARIVFARTYFDDIIFPEGWSDFGDSDRRSTTFFGLYQCSGPGAILSRRAPWSKLLDEIQALPYLTLEFVNGREWINSHPFSTVINKTSTRNYILPASPPSIS